MLFNIRNTTPNDIGFYQYCFENSEFHWNLFGYNYRDIKKSVSYEKRYLKYIISILGNKQQKDIAFTHFCYEDISQEYWFSGGISPQFFNSGMGIYVGVIVLKYFFKLFSSAIVKAGTYKHNKRSTKMLLALGFQIIEIRDNEIIMQITLQLFNNEFVNRVLKRIEIF
ncbi:MAG: hypothetical protein LBQ28_08725 [Prevotellaceae bacterium]|jgi:RimJ/RimL family protein N-acetyltransferase|nr:hypothetical protein [Prevotellaceae bacterium]